MKVSVIADGEKMQSAAKINARARMRNMLPYNFNRNSHQTAFSFVSTYSHHKLYRMEPLKQIKLRDKIRTLYISRYLQ